MKEGNNIHGLSRHIPSSVAREVRQRCGFGCVVCGSALYDYEHFDPEYKNAKSHSVDGIVLLCPTDHRRKLKGLLSDQAYREAINKPKALQNIGADADWETSNFAPTIILGQKLFTGGTSILKIDDELLLGFSVPEEEGAPLRLTARFFDRDETEVFSIIDNRIVCHSDSFDLETSGNKWIVRSAMHKIDLEILLYPPDQITINRLNYRHKKWGLIVKDEKFDILYDGKRSLGFTGDAVINGSCFLDLSGSGSILMKDSTVVFGGLRRLQELQQNTAKPIMFKWPLFFYMDGEDTTPFNEVDLATTNIKVDGGKPQRILAIFTSEQMATQKGSENIPSNYQLRSLGQKGFLMLLVQAAIPKGIVLGVFDPDLEHENSMFTTIDLKEFVTSNNKVIMPDDPCPCQSGKIFKECHDAL